ncbi:hypothetical protein CVT25_008050 [Psilocybe cyanescens]|uniref:Uncharacterized protein n=1 Tax=Psilocybe cyanescens TaxID=93625 RepID=A0A409XG90_PSICY|nr:hypothetical protein CVT25_008050 [Psilocybe cyanescens]
MPVTASLASEQNPRYVVLTSWLIRPHSAASHANSKRRQRRLARPTVYTAIVDVHLSLDHTSSILVLAPPSWIQSAPCRSQGSLLFSTQFVRLGPVIVTRKLSSELFLPPPSLPPSIFPPFSLSASPVHPTFSLGMHVQSALPIYCVPFLPPSLFLLFYFPPPPPPPRTPANTTATDGLDRHDGRVGVGGRVRARPTVHIPIPHPHPSFPHARTHAPSRPQTAQPRKAWHCTARIMSIASIRNRRLSINTSSSSSFSFDHRVASARSAIFAFFFSLRSASASRSIFCIFTRMLMSSKYGPIPSRKAVFLLSSS